MNEIVAKFKWYQNIYLPLTYIILTFIFSIPFIILTKFLFMFLYSADTPTWVTVTCIICGGFIGMLILTNYIRRWFWKLTDQELISGIFFKKRYSLKGITKIVEGLPATSKYQKLELFCEPAAQTAAIYRSKSLFIKFDDRSFLPLNLHGLVNGDQLIAELKAKLNHVLDKSYKYTREETRLLNKHEVNYLIKMGNRECI